MDEGVLKLILEKLKILFHDKTGQDLDKYSEKFIQIKIMERLSELKIESYRAYFDRFTLGDQLEQELEDLFYLIVNRESDFFRYLDHFVFLNEFLLKELIQKKKMGQTIKILCIGISVGQEPYSIAMILEENRHLIEGVNVQMDAVDILKNIHEAENGIFDEDVLRFFLRYKGDSLYKQLFYKYFTRVDDPDIPVRRYRIDDRLKKYMQFKKMDISKDEIQTQYDIIFFRNVMIYFSDELKKKVISKIFHALKPDGYLFLGHSEFPYDLRDKFRIISCNTSIVYQKIKSDGT